MGVRETHDTGAPLRRSHFPDSIRAEFVARILNKAISVPNLEPETDVKKNILVGVLVVWQFLLSAYAVLLSNRDN